MTRSEKVARARALRAEGLKLREIAAEMGVARRTVSNWFSDPDRSKEIARRESYRGRCVDCGAPTDGSDGPGRARERCLSCATEHVKEHGHLHTGGRQFGRRGTILAIQRWARENDGIPPSATDWNTAHAIMLGHPEKAEKFYRDGCWPTTSGVMKAFGSWSAAIIASGLVPNQRGRYGREGEDLDVCQEIADRYLAGESTNTLAAEYGVSVSAIAYRIRKTGTPLRSLREASDLRYGRQAA